ncbi:MAG TPA: FAD-binding oxidoreductase, partial [Acidimicrobiales bacterium]
RMLVDTKNFLFYWRLTPDGRLLFGGRRSLAPSTVSQARDFLHASMLRVHPQLAGVAVDRAWGGEVAITLDRLPHAGRIDGGWYATGCNGSGVALNTWLGARIGQHLAGEAGVPSFAELPHRPIPLHGLRRAYLPLVGLWFRWQDRGFDP